MIVPTSVLCEDIVPAKGMGATVITWSGRHAATILEYDKKSSLIKVQLDHALRLDKNGDSPDQEYEFHQNPKGITYHFKLDARGKWCQCLQNISTGRWVMSGDMGLIVGDRSQYRDYSYEK
jgi:hypothetical protein